MEDNDTLRQRLARYEPVEERCKIVLPPPGRVKRRCAFVQYISPDANRAKRKRKNYRQPDAETESGINAPIPTPSADPATPPSWNDEVHRDTV